MKVNLGVPSQNSKDWERIGAKDFDHPPLTADWEIVQKTLALGDLAEPLGFDGIWAPEHFGTPFGMSPNPIQVLTYFAGRTQHISLGTMVVVAPWWHPVRLAHQIAYLDIASNGRYNTIGIGRGIAKSEFESVGVPREQSRQRFNETLDILKLALTQEYFSYDGEIFQIPRTSIRPQPKSRDLFSRIYGSSATRESLEIISRLGMVPLFVGNKPIEDACKEVQLTNTIRQEVGLPPCQPKNVFFMYCTETMKEAGKAEQYLLDHNRDTSCHYGFNDPSNYAGVKGYEAYATGLGAPPVVNAALSGDQGAKQKPLGYHSSNYLIGTPDEVINRVIAAQKACSFCEMTIVSQFGTMPQEEAFKSVKLFAKEVLPVVHKMDAPLHASALPETQHAKH